MFAVVVLKPVGVDLAVEAAWRQIFAGLAMQMQAHGHRLPRRLVDHPQPHRPIRRRNHPTIGAIVTSVS